MAVEGFGGTNVDVTGLPVYVNGSEAMPVPRRLISAVLPVEELLVMVN
jgi:hypothetical protein